MRLTRSMTKLYNNSTHNENNTRNKRPLSPKPTHHEVVSTNHVAKRTRTRSQRLQPENPSPTTNDHDTPTSPPTPYPIYKKKSQTSTPSPHLKDHEDQRPFESSLSPLDGHDESNGTTTALQGTHSQITDDSQERYFLNSPSLTFVYDDEENLAHSNSPPRSPPPIGILNRSDGLRYNDLTDAYSMNGDNNNNNDDDDDDDDIHYSAFGWPTVDPPAEFDTAPSIPNDDSNSNMSFLSDRPLQRSLIQDFLLVDDYNSNNSNNNNNNNSSHILDDSEVDRTMMTAPHHQPTDEVDLFFSASQADYASMSFSTKLSIQQQKQQFLALARPTYITSWPHFLTLGYFDKHNAQDRSDIVPSPSASPSRNDNDDDNQQQEQDDTGTKNATPLSSASYFDTKFSVLERIGSGEFADVWKVWNTESNEVFAVKKLKIPFQSFSDRWLQLVEVRNMMMVQHSPFCLNLFNAWEQDGYLYLQTDFGVATLADYFLQQRQDQQSVSESHAWKIIYEISMGLQAIHHAGVVHLDLKPSNVMIDANGTLRIGDFGTSIRRPLDAYEFKGEGDRHYMAPDLLREEYDTPADVFSLGLIIFEMMTQVQLPSTGDSWEMLRLGDFSNYKQRLCDVPLEIRRVMLLMLKSSSEDRATIDDILALPHLQRIASTANDQQPGALYDFIQLMQEDEQELN